MSEDSAVASGPVTEDDIRVHVERVDREPLRELEETPERWRLGHLHIERAPMNVRIGWGCTPGPTTEFRLHRFEYADIGRRGSAVIFRSFARDVCQELPEEWVIGWVPTEMEEVAAGWVTTLNEAIAAAVAARPVREPSTGVPWYRRDVTDPEIIRENVRGDLAPIEALQECSDDEDGPAWRIGRVWLFRERVAWVCAGEPSRYPPGAHFFRRAFTHPTSGSPAIAIYFHLGVRGVCRNDCFCGWVPAEREADANRWVMFLNAEIDRARAEERQRALQRAVAAADGA